MIANNDFPEIPIGYITEWYDPDTIPDGWELDKELTEFHQTRYVRPSDGSVIIFPTSHTAYNLDAVVIRKV